jgi:hypothetical protein
MKAGSLVKCIKPFDNSLYFIIRACLLGVPLPAVGETYTVKSLERCTCGKHDVLFLEGHEGMPYDPEHFVELLPAETKETLVNEKDFKPFIIRQPVTV